MNDQQLVVMLEQAAERGARRALEKVGLHDDNAGGDIRDLRDLMKSWREARSAIIKSIAGFVTTALLIAAAIGLGIDKLTR